MVETAEQFAAKAKADAARLDEIARILKAAEERGGAVHIFSELSVEDRKAIVLLAKREAAAVTPLSEQQKWDEMMDRFKLQGAEFDALAVAYNAMQAMPAIVDDGYPEARFKFDGAFYELIAAMCENNRFGVGTHGALALLRVGLVVTEKK